MQPLKGGIRLDGKKEATLLPWTALRPDPPKTVRIPLQGRFSATSVSTVGSERTVPVVKTGDRVRVGEKIAETQTKPHLGIHASISGKVTEVKDVIEIHSDGKDEALPEIGKERRGWESLPKAEIFPLLHESGISLAWRPSVKTVVMNGCESEPYLTSDHCLLMSHPVEMLKAGEILRRIFEAEAVLFVLEDNKEEVVEFLRSKIFFHTGSKARVEVFPARYPQEHEKVLTRSLGLRPEETVVLNVAPAYAIYEAVVLQKPFYERVVTIAGECVAQPRNFWLRIGTSVKDSVKCARGFLRKPAKVVLGGPLTGWATDDLETPVTKEIRGILGLPAEIVKPEKVEPCIRCGRCLESCPVSISPALITLAAEKDLFDLAREYGASLCIECGNCTYVCPSKRPMRELIQYVNAR